MVRSSEPDPKPSAAVTGTLTGTPTAADPDRLALDVLSPLPPVRSGISDYTVDLLPHLAALADVRVVALPGQPVAAAVVERWSPIPLAAAGYGSTVSAGTVARLPLYQMGNNKYHVAVEETARRFPGVLVLHDVVLHHLLLAQTAGRGDFAAYQQRLRADQGLLGDAAAPSRAWGGWAEASQFAFPTHRSLLRNQRGVLVHSRWAADEVAAGDPQIRVRAVPMGIPLPSLPDLARGRQFRDRHQIPADAMLLGSFGFQTPIKRPEVAIRALADRRLATVHLLIAGAVAEVLDLTGEARRVGVAERVHVTGYLPWDELEAAIVAADLALNLRYPSAGETSASLLRVMALGRPAVVSDFAQFAELPSEVAVRVPVGADEVAVLAAALAELVATPERRREMGRAARRHVAEHHDPAAAAAAVVEACRAWRDLPPPDSRSIDATQAVADRPPTSLTWSELDLEVNVELASELDATSSSGESQALAALGLVQKHRCGSLLPWPAGTRREVHITLRNKGVARLLAGRRGAGGVVLELELIAADGRDVLAGKPWLDLPRDLEPGEQQRFSVTLRRPLGPPGTVRLRVTPHVLGRSSAEQLAVGELVAAPDGGGSVWESQL